MSQKPEKLPPSSARPKPVIAGVPATGYVRPILPPTVSRPPASVPTKTAQQQPAPQAPPKPSTGTSLTTSSLLYSSPTGIGRQQAPGPSKDKPLPLMYQPVNREQSAGSNISSSSAGSSAASAARRPIGAPAMKSVHRPIGAPPADPTTSDLSAQRLGQLPVDFDTEGQRSLSRAHTLDHLLTCPLHQMPSGRSLSLHRPYDVLEAIVERLPFEYLSRPALSTNLSLRAAAMAAQEVSGTGAYQSVSSYKYNLLPAELVKNIVLAARDLLMGESLVVQIDAPVVIAGDIHGQYQDLINVFAEEPPCGGKYLSRLQTLKRNYAARKGEGQLPDANDSTTPSSTAAKEAIGKKRPRGPEGQEPSKLTPRKYLFLGDYVDRGDYSVETMVTLLCLKILEPEQVFLLRGNHESATISRTYGFLRECTNKYGHGGGLGGEGLWKTFVEMFMCLPVIALVNNAIFCVHGGIPRDVDSVQRILAMQDMRPYDTPNHGFLCDLVWSDPEDHDAEYLPNSRRVSYTFNEGALDLFLRRNELQLICRAHQVMEHGYGFFPPPRGSAPSTRKLVTIFTASNYVNSFANAGAIMLVDADLSIRFKVFNPVGLRELAYLQRGAAPEDVVAAQRALEAAEGATMLTK